MLADFIFNVVPAPCKALEAGRRPVTHLVLPPLISWQGILPHLYLVLKTPEPGIASCKEVSSQL